MNAKLIALSFLGAVPFSIFAVKSALFDPGGPITVHVEIVDSLHEAPATFDVPLVGKECGQATAHHRRADFELELCRSGGSDAEPIVRFKVSAVESNEERIANRLLKFSTRLDAPMRSVATVKESDGAEIRILAHR